MPKLMRHERDALVGRERLTYLDAEVTLPVRVGGEHQTARQRRGQGVNGLDVNDDVALIEMLHQIRERRRSAHTLCEQIEDVSIGCTDVTVRRGKQRLGSNGAL